MHRSSTLVTNRSEYPDHDLIGFCLQRGSHADYRGYAPLAGAMMSGGSTSENLFSGMFGRNIFIRGLAHVS